jgi:predicted DNA-binding protein with PD1-like motif
MAEQESFLDYWKTHKEIRFDAFEGKAERIVTARLLAGADLLNGIVEIARKFKIRAGIVNVAFGSLSRAVIRWEKRGPTKIGGVRSEPHILEGPISVLSAQAKVGVPKEGEPVIHMHGVVVDANGKIWGGHLFPDENPTWTTMEVVIQEIPGLEFALAHDPELGAELLQARRIE